MHQFLQIAHVQPLCNLCQILGLLGKGGARRHDPLDRGHVQFLGGGDDDKHAMFLWVTQSVI